MIKNHQINKIIKRGYSSSALNIPLGYKASGIYSGIKKDTTQKDISIIHSTAPCKAAAVFTQNQFCAAPVQVCKQIIKTNKDNIYTLITNSGCANAVTGELGLKNAWRMVELGDKINNINNSTLIMSTGVIGHQLPMEKVETGIQLAIQELSDNEKVWHECSKGFMTTDTFPKLKSSKVELDNNSYFNLLGISKGAGMIHPNMATLLSTVITDVNITSNCLQKALSYATERSFNSITIDGDTSTNDTCIVLANGLQNNNLIEDSQSNQYLKFQYHLTEIMIELAKLIVKDAEGATKFLTINIKQADTYENAKIIGNSIATSSLVKTAFYGQDANWGRIIAAIGYSGVKVDTNKVNLSFITDDDLSINLLKDGQPLQMDEQLASQVMQNKNITLNIDLGLGNSEATIYTCDLSHQYVTINGAYRT